jgi:hypothetical protein
MNNIILYSDLQKIYNEHYDVVVRSIEDYVDAYKCILDAIYSRQPLIVVVQNKYCLKYFYKMQENYKETILIKINSPIERLQELAGVSIPDYISDEDLVKDHLQQKLKEIAFNSSISFEENILNHYLGVYFTRTHFPFIKLVDFLKGLDLTALESKNNIILNKVYKRRIRLWQEKCNEEYEKNILNAFLEDYKILLTKVSKYLILKNYPRNITEDIVGDIAKDFDSMRLKDEPFIPEHMDTTDIQRNIKLVLNQKIKSDLSFEDLVREIENLSGLFIEELQFVYNLLTQNQSILDPTILRIIRNKFRTGDKLDLQFQERLNNLIPPAEVINPENIKTLDEWISWALTSYLPYRFWMESNDVSNDMVDKYSLMYGDWIYNNYDRIISSETRMLHRTITNLSKCIKEDEISLIIILDNFNYKFATLCKDYFNCKGFSTTMDRPLISMIPTETSVSKTAFFSGQPFNIEEKSYESMCKEWEDLLGGNIEYLSDIGKLDSVNQKVAKIYILNYLSIDRILHESQSNSALPIYFRIQEELKAMIDKLLSFSKKLGVENRIKIYFTSDHGSTKILKEQQNLIDSKYYKAKSEDCAYRVLALQDKKFDIYKDSIGHLCYVLDRNDYGIKENYLIARGYSRFMETDSSFYVHGGITPEENIIPLLKFERVNVKLIEPEILLRNISFRYSTTSTIHLTIKNYNEYAIENIRISIVNSNVRWERAEYNLLKIDKESQVDIYLEKIRILKTSIDNDKLLMKIRFGFLGKEFEKDQEFLIKTISTQENKIDFDDLF